MPNDREVTSYLICECTQCNVVWSFDWQESPCSCNTSDKALQLSIDTQNLVEVQANSWREALVLYVAVIAVTHRCKPHDRQTTRLAEEPTDDAE